MTQRNNITKIIAVLLITFLMFKKVLRLYHLDVYLFIIYFSLFAASIVLVNNYLKKNYLARLYRTENSNNIGLTTLLATAINAVVIFTIALLVKVVNMSFVEEGEVVNLFIDGRFKPVLNFTVFYTILMGIYFHVTFSSLVKDKELEEQKVITGNVSAQFESLKNQLDPHFLFNSLNVLGALIEEDQDKALGFNNSLSKTYRYILDQKNKELVPIEEELAFAKTYIELLQMRFEDSLVFELPTEIKQEGAKVVPLSLQLLLENVIKHNKASAQRPIHITIKEGADGYLIIKNTLNKKQVLDNRKGIGLENIASRYALLTSKPVFIEETEEYFTVRIPILTKIIEHMKIIDVPENEQEILVEAKKKVEKIKKFYAHLTTFIMVNSFLIMLNLLTEPSFMWSLIPLFAWGIGLASDAMKTFNYSLFLGKDWEDKKIREYMDKHKGEGQKWN
ncbi:2TM domain-containing protein [Myroides sp. M-43]|uniref:2TM domain-containing protein n=1 Tax=Myroides oncorhynchi TaxID=2893756 RepID=UPI001E4F4AAA|nr:2TM domain-containing protein [Myroides oncorhynchi]MCC9044091.1 2TM domain-containing protein [Myroides oncorhynchi]